MNFLCFIQRKKITENPCKIHGYNTFKFNDYFDT